MGQNRIVVLRLRKCVIRTFYTLTKNCRPVFHSLPTPPPIPEQRPFGSVFSKFFSKKIYFQKIFYFFLKFGIDYIF